jgi:hypothetical protein
MKIVEHTDRYLQLTDQNRQCWWGLLLAMPFLLVGSMMTAATFKVVILECQRTEDNQIDCQRTVQGILSTEKDKILGHLKSVETVKTSGTGIVLTTTTDNKMDLAPYRSFVTSQQQQNTDRLNAFIANSQQAKILVVQDDRLMGSLWSLNFIFGGAIVVLAALAIPLQMSCKFDRSNGEVTIAKKYLIYGIRQQVIPLSTIDRVEPKQLLFAIANQPFYNLHLISSTSKHISLSIPSRNLTEYQTIIETANNFIQQ